jgi:regulatory protein
MSSEALERALGVAYRYLGHRDRTVAEMRTHLLKKGMAEPEVEAVVNTLAAQAYLDDARFAERYAEDRRQLDGWGADRIERKLVELGVAREHVSAALAGFDHGTELDAAIAVLRTRHREPPADDRERERALGYLVRKGYDLETAYDAVRSVARAEAA